MSPLQLNPPQLVRLTCFSGRPTQRWALYAAPHAVPLPAGNPAAASATSWGTTGCRPGQLRHSTAAQLLQAGLQHSSNQWRGCGRHRRGGLQITAAAGVLQPPIAGETLTQLAARFMASQFWRLFRLHPYLPHAKLSARRVMSGWGFGTDTLQVAGVLPGLQGTGLGKS